MTPTFQPSLVTSAPAGWTGSFTQLPGWSAANTSGETTVIEITPADRVAELMAEHETTRPKGSGYRDTTPLDVIDNHFTTIAFTSLTNQLHAIISGGRTPRVLVGGCGQGVYSAALKSKFGNQLVLHTNDLRDVRVADLHFRGDFGDMRLIPEGASTYDHVLLINSAAFYTNTPMATLDLGISLLAPEGSLLTTVNKNRANPDNKESILNLHDCCTLMPYGRMAVMKLFGVDVRTCLGMNAMFTSLFVYFRKLPNFTNASATEIAAAIKERIIPSFDNSGQKSWEIIDNIRNRPNKGQYENAIANAIYANWVVDNVVRAKIVHDALFPNEEFRMYGYTAEDLIVAAVETFCRKYTEWKSQPPDGSTVGRYALQLIEILLSSQYPSIDEAIESSFKERITMYNLSYD